MTSYKDGTPSSLEFMEYLFLDQRMAHSTLHEGCELYQWEGDGCHEDGRCEDGRREASALWHTSKSRVHSPAFPSAGPTWSLVRYTRLHRQRSLSRLPAGTPL